MVQTTLAKMKVVTTQRTYRQMQRFANMTKVFIIRGELHRARRCLKIAEELLSKGSLEVRCAVTNVFIYSVSSFMECHHYSIKRFFPKSLQTEYYKQVYTSGT